MKINQCMLAFRVAGFVILLTSGACDKTIDTEVATPLGMMQLPADSLDIESGAVSSRWWNVAFRSSCSFAMAEQTLAAIVNEFELDEIERDKSSMTTTFSNSAEDLHVILSDSLGGYRDKNGRSLYFLIIYDAGEASTKYDDFRDLKAP